jgi:hypothetical protein
VVHVPVQDEHSPSAELGDRQRGGDGGAVEQAEAHRAVRFGVVPRGPGGGEAERGLGRQQSPDHLAGAAGRVQGSAVGRLADDRVEVDRSAAAGRQSLDVGNLLRLVDQLDRAPRSRGRLAPLPAEPVLAAEQPLDRQQPLRCVGVPGHQHTGVVLERRGM